VCVALEVGTWAVLHALTLMVDIQSRLTLNTSSALTIIAVLNATFLAGLIS
jgi:hypothetical protein